VSKAGKENCKKDARQTNSKRRARKAWSDQGRINMPEMMKLLKISQNTARRIRREILKHYHEQKDSRSSQWGSAITQESSAFDQQEGNAQQSA
jgi:hypothetical protein